MLLSWYHTTTNSWQASTTMLKDSKSSHWFTAISSLSRKSSRCTIFIHICVFICSDRIYRSLRSIICFLFFCLKHMFYLRSDVCKSGTIIRRRWIVINCHNFNITFDKNLFRRVILNYILISIPGRLIIFILIG